MESIIKQATDQLKEGRVILYPSDTIWGIGCDACNEKAVERIFEIKKRPAEKSMIVLVDSEAMLNKYVKEVPSLAWDLIEFADKPLTIIYDQPYNIATNLLASDGTLAIRLVKDDFCKRLIHKFGKPLVSTSANFSGVPTPSNFSQIDEAVKSEVDYVVNWRQSEIKNAPVSTIIRLGNNGDVKIIRK
ncbi:MAG: threonylcarbamoyl-AMP synthase [Bacteroidetes bacterium]|nr:threonylcarbamoyl-AMP synthase [Bacteroidota bacterium]MBK9672256.1 threonylcarbamoyl-AMP synthase [Bacteroidota bacterium]MBK9800117.1 threonylcarbamoyl-AMP synthase [Bacteroidota bacterium]